MTALQIDEIDGAWFSPRLGDLDGVVTDAEDINQCIAIILQTYPGEDIHRPEFGSRLRDWIDAPTNLATPQLVRESWQAIERWEPRIILNKILVDPNTPEIHQVQLLIDWQLADDALVTGTAEVGL